MAKKKKYPEYLDYSKVKTDFTKPIDIEGEYRAPAPISPVSERAQKLALGAGSPVEDMASSFQTVPEPVKNPQPASPELEAPELKDGGGDLNWDWGELAIGIVPALAGLISGDAASGYSIGGKGLVDRQKQLMELNRERAKLLRDKASKTKPLSKSNVLFTEGPEGKVAKTVDEMVRSGLPVYEDPDHTLTFDQRKALESHKAGLREKEDKGGESFKNEKTLRNDYSKDKVTIQTKDRTASYSVIKALVQAPQTSANDLSMVFAYMKMLDPTSVVREGEQTTAKKTGAIPDYLWNQYQRLTQGKDALLPGKVRKQFAEEAYRIQKAQLGLQNQVDSQYKRIATQYGLNPANVVILPSAGGAPKYNRPKAPHIMQNGKVLDLQPDGKTYKIRRNK